LFLPAPVMSTGGRHLMRQLGVHCEYTLFTVFSTISYPPGLKIS
jgi:hypothetical protein